MPKKYYRGKKVKYSVESTAQTIEVDASGKASTVVVPSDSIQGMRKVKHLTVSIADLAGSTASTPLYWALVYVPAGTEANAISIDSGDSMYEPNQFVLNCGVTDFSAGPTRFHSPLARNLNSGDAIYLIIQQAPDTVSTTIKYAAVVKYAITLH